VSVNCSGRDAAFLAPNLGQKFGPGKHASGFTSKHPEERKLLRGQSDSMGADADAMVVAVQADAAEQETVPSGGNLKRTGTEGACCGLPPGYLRQKAAVWKSMKAESFLKRSLRKAFTKS